MSKLFNYIDTESKHNCAGELKSTDLPDHDHHLLYYTKEQCEAMFALAQHNHDERYAQKDHSHQAKDIATDTTHFNKNLTAEDYTVQRALDRLDEINAEGLPSGNKNLQTLHYKNNRWQPNKSLLIDNSSPYYIMPNYDDHYNGTVVHVICPREVNGFNERAISFSVNPNEMAIDSSRAGNQLMGYKFQLGLSMPYSVSPNTFLTYLNLEGSNTLISLKTNERNTQPTVFKINENKLTLSKDGVIKSASLAGEGEAFLKALSDGTIVRVNNT